MNQPLQLAPVHEGLAPALWPPAPGWWLAATVILAVAAWLVRRMLGRRRRRVAVLRLFDKTVEDAGTPSRQVAAMSELLRRAARRQDARADTLEGEEWLRFLDAGLAHPAFVDGAGRLLRDGAFRADVAQEEADALRAVARQRYLGWMQGA